jgi:hypothetical protein
VTSAATVEGSWQIQRKMRRFWFWFIDLIAAKERMEHRDKFFAVFVFYCG